MSQSFEIGGIRRDQEKDWQMPRDTYTFGRVRVKDSPRVRVNATSIAEHRTRDVSQMEFEWRHKARTEEYHRQKEEREKKHQEQAKQPSGFDKAVDGLRRAEKAATFEKAILAAEAAATSAPSEQQEELAAAAAAKFLQAANVTSVEKMKRTLVDGDKLIEVVGYIGITKPKEKKQG